MSDHHNHCCLFCVQEDDPGRQQGASSVLQLRSKDLQERLMVSEATVQAQAEQLKDYRELLSE